MKIYKFGVSLSPITADSEEDAMSEAIEMIAQSNFDIELQETVQLHKKLVSLNPTVTDYIPEDEAVARYNEYLRACTDGREGIINSKSFKDWLETEI